VLDPPRHRLWTANSRVGDAAAVAAIGDGGYVLGARATQIRDDLFAKDRFEPADMLAIQLDDRTLFLERWWHLSALEQGNGLNGMKERLAELGGTLAIETGTGRGFAVDAQLPLEATP
jgi:glucose-6-phosphate-specific signal transduction histidine kinase